MRVVMPEGPARSYVSARVISPSVSTIIFAAIIVGALYLGQEIFVPIALAILLSFVLAPLVSILEDWHFPRVVAVFLTVAVAFAAIFMLGGVIASQVTKLAQQLPQYQSTMQKKIGSLRGYATSSPLDRAADILQGLNKELNKPAVPQEAPAGAPVPVTAPPEESKPIPVIVRSPPLTAFESITSLIKPLLHPLATIGVVIVFVLFILFQREDLRNRLIRLAGTRDLQATTSAIDDAARRLSRLFLTQLLLNATFGLAIGIGLWLIGIPSAVLWGILAAILRFVPYIGAFIAAIIPLTLAAAVDPGWSMLLWTGAMIVITELIVGQVIEPLLYGRSSGLSPVAVVVSATFWTALWGPIGLVPATPLTICLVVLGRHVDRLEFFDILLGDRPVLSPQEIFYQRMLAGDPGESVDKAEEFLKEKSLSQYYEEVALKGLQLAQVDVMRGILGPERAAGIRDAVANVVEELENEADTAKGSNTADQEAGAAIAMAPTALELPTLEREDLAAAWRSEHPVLCVPERSDLDEAGALILAQILTKHGLAARAVKKKDIVVPSGLSHPGGKDVAMICLSAFDNTSPAQTRYIVRRLRRTLPEAKILLIYWMMDEHTTVTKEAMHVDGVVSTLREAATFCLEAAKVNGQSAPRAVPAEALAEPDDRPKQYIPRPAL
jgi:predicted PurR-regulated permease PerM